jgi:hypothetical protein
MHKHALSNSLLFSKIAFKRCLSNPINKLYTTPREIQLLEFFYRNPIKKIEFNQLDIKLIDELFYAR